MNINLVNKLLLRFIGAYPGSRFAYALQDEKTFALTRYEWLDTLQDYGFEDKNLMDAFHDAKEIYKQEVPTIGQFLELAKMKAKIAKDFMDMERRKEAPKIERKIDPVEVAEAKQKFKDLLKKLKVNN